MHYKLDLRDCSGGCSYVCLVSLICSSKPQDKLLISMYIATLRTAYMPLNDNALLLHFVHVIENIFSASNTTIASAILLGATETKAFLQ